MTGLNKQQAAKNTKTLLKQQRTKFKKPSAVPGTKTETTSQNPIKSRSVYNKQYKNNPVYSKSRQMDSSTYYSRRDRYYNDWSAPSYVYMGAPSYGLWDTLFLYSMMSNMNNNNAANFAYNHQNDPDYKAWRREADKQAQTNAELRAQLAAIDAKTQKMTGKIDPSYLPAGVDPDIALAQEARDSIKPIFRLGVASKDGAYFRVAANALIPYIDSVIIVPVVTSGTHEILAKIAAGELDGGFLQSDGYWNYIEENQTTNLPFERVFSPFQEAVHMICNQNIGSEVDDLTSKHKVWFPKNSGAMETWINFVNEDSTYGKIQTVLNTPSMAVTTTEEALLKVRGDKNSCALYVAAPGATTLMRNVENGAKQGELILIDVNDSDFNDTTDPVGDPVYTFKKIPEKTYPNLLSKAGMIYGGGSIKTLYLNADFVVANKWKQTNSSLYPSFATTIIGLQPEINAVVKQSL